MTVLMVVVSPAVHPPSLQKTIFPPSMEKRVASTQDLGLAGGVTLTLGCQMRLVPARTDRGLAQPTGPGRRSAGRGRVTPCAPKGWAAFVATTLTRQQMDMGAGYCRLRKYCAAGPGPSRFGGLGRG